MSESADDAKKAFIAHYIDTYVMPRMRDEKEARHALEFFEVSPHFGSEHYLRYLETFDRLVRLVDLTGKKIGETGHLSALSAYFRDNGHDVHAIEGDFRYSLNSESELYDILFCLEVLEHIKDQNSDLLDEIVLTNYSGVKRFFSEMHRVLCKDGLLLLTTPNANSLVVVWRAIHNEAPWLFEPHVREFTIDAVKQFAKEAGFELLAVDTMYVCFFLQDRSELLKAYIENQGASSDNRGDDSFFLFRKVG